MEPSPLKVLKFKGSKNNLVPITIGTKFTDRTWAGNVWRRPARMVLVRRATKKSGNIEIESVTIMMFNLNIFS